MADTEAGKGPGARDQGAGGRGCCSKDFAQPLATTAHKNRPNFLASKQKYFAPSSRKETLAKRVEGVCVCVGGVGVEDCE